jgi:ribosomal protein S18 acetylase RimI-like enzyme
VLSVADSPDAFGDTLADVQAQPDVHWQRLAGTFVSELQRFFIAIEGDALVGSAYTRVGDDGYGHIGSMWVAPTHRRQKLGCALLETAMDWLACSGVSVAQLWVTEGNEPATTFYRAAGFVFTGEREKLREGSDLYRNRMEKRLGA